MAFQLPRSPVDEATDFFPTLAFNDKYLTHPFFTYKTYFDQSRPTLFEPSTKPQFLDNVIAPNRHRKSIEKEAKNRGGGKALDRGKGRVGEADPKIARNMTLMHLMRLVDLINLLSTHSPDVS